MIAACAQALAAAALLTASLATDARAQAPADIAALSDALRIEETIGIMRQEGLEFGAGLGRDMLPEGDGDGWREVVSRIHDIDKMRALVEVEFARALHGEDVAAMLEFFQNGSGEEVVALELAARRALLDSAVEDAARERLERQRHMGAPLLDVIETIIADSDLVERNVAGAMNANLLFYEGLLDGGAVDMTQDDILSDVWSQEDTVREDAHLWLHSFLLLAYAPLDAGKLDAYAAFYRTPKGRALTDAMFTAFNRMYDDISYLLGQAIAQRLSSQKL